jgi:predicted metal-dependent phosphotriesterase family hydrolase
LLPALKSAGLEEGTLLRLLVDNPRKAFTVRVRLR